MASTARILALSDPNTLHHVAYHRVYSSSNITSYDVLEISISRHRRCFSASPCLSLKIQPRMLRSRNRDSVVTFSTTGDSSKPSSDSPWKSWLLGAAVPLLIPFMRNRWAPILIVINKAEATVEKLDDIAEVVHEVAKKVEEIADDVGNNLPEDAKLKDVVDQIENTAKKISDHAQAADELLDQIDEMRERVEEDVQALADAGNEGNVEVKQDKADTNIDKLDEIVEVVEKVAKTVEEIADQVGNKLPQDAKLRNVIDQIENVARKISEDANSADELLDKIERIRRKS